MLLNIFLVYKSSSENKTLENVKLKEAEKIPKGLAIMIETEHNSDDYEESNTNSWPKTGYKFNKEKSGCIDNSGSTIETSLSYDSTTNIVTVDTGVTTKCYIYFDKRYSLEELCTSGEDTLGECLTNNNSAIESLDNTAYSGMYRYTGTQELVDDNYICFGTTDKEECVNNSDKYMYRVIGVASENNDTLGLETNQLKLIKETSIGTHEWHSDYTTDTNWESSTIYSYLQNDVLNNITYYPSGWSNKIDSVKWNIGDVQTYTDGNTIYGLENSIQTVNTSKMGLMYVSDYYYAYNSGGKQNCNSTSCINWLTDTSNVTWMMSRYGDNGSGYYGTWLVYLDGYATWNIMNYLLAVRPVFYLTKNEIYASGNGTIDDPIILRENASETIIRKDTESDIGLQQEIITGDDLYRFSGIQGNTGINNYVCLGTTEKCKSGSDNMYRIIGVNPTNGEIKVIKETLWNNSTTYAWHSNAKASWLESDLYTNTASQIYDILSFKNMIVTNHEWNIGVVNSESISNRTDIIDYENNATGTANIGIVSLTDYYLAYNNDLNWADSNSTTSLNWIFGALNGNSLNHEWTMTNYGYNGYNYLSWFLNFNIGIISYDVVVGKGVIRPVFYLKPNVYITNPNAAGTSTDPFIISY